MLDLMPMAQDMEGDLNLLDLEISKDFSILQSSDIWIADTAASNDAIAHKKGIINLRKNESSLKTIGIVGDTVNRYLCIIP